MVTILALVIGIVIGMRFRDEITTKWNRFMSYTDEATIEAMAALKEQTKQVQSILGNALAKDNFFLELRHACEEHAMFDILLSKEIPTGVGIMIHRPFTEDGVPTKLINIVVRDHGTGFVGFNQQKQFYTPNELEDLGRQLCRFAEQTMSTKIILDTARA